MERFRAAIDPQCHSCGALSWCHGGCRATVLESGTDSLIDNSHGPIRPLLLHPLRLKLHPDSCPLLLATIQTESWGLVLLRGSHLVALEKEAASILELLNGKITLKEIQMRLGVDALSLVGKLFSEQMITLM
jgi:hypothetical protein